MKHQFILIFVILAAIACGDAFLRQCAGNTVGFGSAFWAIVLSLPLGAAWAYAIALLGRGGKFLYGPLFAWVIFAEGVAWFLQNQFPGNLESHAGLLATLLNTSPSEMYEFISARLTWTTCCGIGIGILFLAILYIWVHKRRKPYRHPGKRHLAFALAIATLLTLALGRHAALCRAIWDHSFITQCTCLELYRDLRVGGKALPPASCTSSLPENSTVLFVIGESSARTHWSLYGYPRNTTPRLTARAGELLVFSNCTASASLTPYALRDALTTTLPDARTLSIPALTDAAGFESAFWSVQGRLKFFPTADDTLFQTVRNRHYLPEEHPLPVYDSDVLPPLRAWLKQKHVGRRIFFAHLYGSHMNWEERYPAQNSAFPTAHDKTAPTPISEHRASINAYDNSIVFTDRILDEMITALKQQPEPTLFVYFSDHGESPCTHGRNPNDPELFAIPFFVWASPALHATQVDLYRRLRDYCGLAIDSHDLFGIFRDLLGLSPIRVR